MSRFKSSPTRPLLAPAGGYGAASASVAGPAPPGTLNVSLPRFSSANPSVQAGSDSAPRQNVVGTIGFWALWIYIFSIASLLNEISSILFGTKPYSTTIAGPIMAAALVFSGLFFRGFRTKSGMLWLIMLAFMAVGLPFSVWKSDSLAQWFEYATRAYPLFFFVCAAVVTVRRCEQFLYAQIIAGGIVVVLVSRFGENVDGRLRMAQGTFANPNSLALQLLLGGCCFVYLIYRGGTLMRLIGGLGAAGAALLVFETGSRGELLAIAGAILALIFTLRRNSARLKLVAVIAILGVSAIVAAVSSPAAFRRLTDISFSDQPSGGDGDLGSQLAREELLRTSLKFTLMHPLLGVGMGEFPVAVDSDAREKGQKSSWMGTHNTYTQVSSECGIPAALCYIAVLAIAIRSSRRLYREFSQYPGEEAIAGMALTLFVILVCLAISIFFFHLAYTYYVPVFCAMTIALQSGAASHRRATA
jgi:hypothetical protein